MAQSLTPESVARAILIRFKAISGRSGCVMLPKELTSFRAGLMLTGDEVLGGLWYAGDQGWIENAGRRGIRLTEAGFAAMELDHAYRTQGLKYPADMIRAAVKVMPIATGQDETVPASLGA